MSAVIVKWYEAVASGDKKKVKSLLDKDCVFYSPIVFKPQEGRALSVMYLSAAMRMFHQAESFKYVKQIVGERDAVLTFEAQIDHTFIDGLDMISWNENEKITTFKVMIRPMKGLLMVGEKMKDQLSNLSLKDKASLKIDQMRRSFLK